MKSENSNEIAVYDLLETHDFDQLSINEQNLVLEFMSAEEYAVSRDMMRLSSAAYSDMEELEPMGLILPIQSKPFLLRTIPVYQLFLSIAAVLIAFLLIIPFVVSNQEETLKTVTVTKVDTLYIAQVKYDTVVKEKPIYIETVNYVDRGEDVLKEAPRLLEVNTPLTPLGTVEINSLENGGLSMKEDPTSILIQAYQLLNEN